MMKINNTIIAPVLKAILIVILIEGCSPRLGMNIETGGEAESADVFREFTKLVDGRDLSDADATRRFLDQHTEALTKTYKWEELDYTLLHYAAEQGVLWLVEELTNNREVDVNIKTRDSGVTPLQCAAKNGHLAVVKELLQQGANVYEEDKRNATALHYAASGSRPEVFKHLDSIIHKQGKYIPKKDKDGFNLLHLVALSVNEECDTEALERSRDLADFIICKYGSSMIDEPDDGRCTPLHFAAKYGNTPLVKLLIEHCADAAVDYNKRRSAARIAQRAGHREIAELILDSAVTTYPPIKQCSVFESRLGKNSPS